ncbi:MAG TPA: GspE/PulE family protein [Thermoanaerobaculia bacterium]|nr:GspE/PulE family protein [Thermoanaerobaculia bacterium]
MDDREFFEKVGKTLLTYKLITEKEHEEIELVREKGLSFEHALHQAAQIPVETYRRILEEVSGSVAVDPSQITIDKDFIFSILEVLPLPAIVGLKIFPISLGGNELTLAMPNPSNEELLRGLESTTSLRVKPVVTTYRGVQLAIEQNFGPMLPEVLKELRDTKPDEVLAKIHERKVGTDIGPAYENFLALVNRSYERAKEDAEDLDHFLVHPTVVDYSQRLLMNLILRNCSDIHIEPGSSAYRIRTRINGVLTTVFELPKKCGEVVNTRVKKMAGIALQEIRTPVDGQINYSPVYGRRVEFRVSVLPTIHGNKTVMRLLEKGNQSVGLDKIGLTSEELERVQRNIGAPNGLILVTGPTGSGKTSTLYSILSVLNDDERCIVTAEEPVESEIPGVVQVPCGKDCTFAMALRSFLRQDPDVIMVGEIRDQETADIALKAALTGHLVLSTLHTNDAPTAVMRLLNLDMDPFIVASSLRMVVAQRLMRTLCRECKVPIKRTSLLENFAPIDVPESEDLFTRGGCARCNLTGYAGRIGVFEILQGGDEMTDAINRRASLGEIREIAEKNGMLSLRAGALRLCASGVTSVEEVVRVTAE